MVVVVMIKSKSNCCRDIDRAMNTYTYSSQHTEPSPLMWLSVQGVDIRIYRYVVEGLYITVDNWHVNEGCCSHTTIHIVLCVNGGESMGYGILLLGGGRGELVERTYQGYIVSEIIVSTQIARTRAEPQQIVAQRLLSCLQYPVPYLSRLQRI